MERELSTTSQIDVAASSAKSMTSHEVEREQSTTSPKVVEAPSAKSITSHGVEREQSTTSQKVVEAPSAKSITSHEVERELSTTSLRIAAAPSTELHPNISETLPYYEQRSVEDVYVAIKSLLGLDEPTSQKDVAAPSAESITSHGVERKQSTTSQKDVAAPSAESITSHGVETEQSTTSQIVVAAPSTESITSHGVEREQSTTSQTVVEAPSAKSITSHEVERELSTTSLRIAAAPSTELHPNISETLPYYEQRSVEDVYVAIKSLLGLDEPTSQKDVAAPSAESITSHGVERKQSTTSQKDVAAPSAESITSHGVEREQSTTSQRVVEAPSAKSGTSRGGERELSTMSHNVVAAPSAKSVTSYGVEREQSTTSQNVVAAPSAKSITSYGVEREQSTMSQNVVAAPSAKSMTSYEVERELSTMSQNVVAAPSAKSITSHEVERELSTTSLRNAAAPSTELRPKTSETLPYCEQRSVEDIYVAIKSCLGLDEPTSQNVVATSSSESTAESTTSHGVEIELESTSSQSYTIDDIDTVMKSILGLDEPRSSAQETLKANESTATHSVTAEQSATSYEPVSDISKTNQESTSDGSGRWKPAAADSSLHKTQPRRSGRYLTHKNLCSKCGGIKKKKKQPSTGARQEWTKRTSDDRNTFATSTDAMLPASSHAPNEFASTALQPNTEQIAESDLGNTEQLFTYGLPYIEAVYTALSRENVELHPVKLKPSTTSYEVENGQSTTSQNVVATSSSESTVDSTTSHGVKAELESTSSSSETIVDLDAVIKSVLGLNEPRSSAHQETLKANEPTATHSVTTEQPITSYKAISDMPKTNVCHNPKCNKCGGTKKTKQPSTSAQQDQQELQLTISAADNTPVTRTTSHGVETEHSTTSLVLAVLSHVFPPDTSETRPYLEQCYRSVEDIPSAITAYFGQDEPPTNGHQGQTKHILSTSATEGDRQSSKSSRDEQDAKATSSLADRTSSTTGIQKMLTCVDVQEDAVRSTSTATRSGTSSTATDSSMHNTRKRPVQTKGRCLQLKRLCRACGGVKKNKKQPLTGAPPLASVQKVRSNSSSSSSVQETYVKLSASPLEMTPRRAIDTAASGKVLSDFSSREDVVTSKSQTKGQGMSCTASSADTSYCTVIDKTKIECMLRDLASQHDLVHKHRSTLPRLSCLGGSALGHINATRARHMSTTARGSTMMDVCKDSSVDINRKVLDDTTFGTHNTQTNDETALRRGHTQSHARGGQFVYSQRDNVMTLAELKYEKIPDDVRNSAMTSLTSTFSTTIGEYSGELTSDVFGGSTRTCRTESNTHDTGRQYTHLSSDVNSGLVCSAPVHHRTSIKTHKNDAEFSYSKRDHSMPLAELKYNEIPNDVRNSALTSLTSTFSTTIGEYSGELTSDVFGGSTRTCRTEGNTHDAGRQYTHLSSGVNSGLVCSAPVHHRTSIKTHKNDAEFAYSKRDHSMPLAELKYEEIPDDVRNSAMTSLTSTFSTTIGEYSGELTSDVFGGSTRTCRTEGNTHDAGRQYTHLSSGVNSGLICSAPVYHRTSIKTQKNDAEFAYSKRDHWMPLAEPMQYKQRIDDESSQSEDSVGAAESKATVVPARINNSTSSQQNGLSTSTANPTVGESQGIARMLVHSTPGYRRANIKDGKNDVEFLYSKRDHSVALAEHMKNNDVVEDAWGQSVNSQRDHSLSLAESTHRLCPDCDERSDINTIPGTGTNLDDVRQPRSVFTFEDFSNRSPECCSIDHSSNTQSNYYSRRSDLSDNGQKEEPVPTTPDVNTTALLTPTQVDTRSSVDIVFGDRTGSTPDVFTMTVPDDKTGSTLNVFTTTVAGAKTRSTPAVFTLAVPGDNTKRGWGSLSLPERLGKRQCMCSDTSLDLKRDNDSNEHWTRVSTVRGLGNISQSAGKVASAKSENKLQREASPELNAELTTRKTTSGFSDVAAIMQPRHQHNLTDVGVTMPPRHQQYQTIPEVTLLGPTTEQVWPEPTQQCPSRTSATSVTSEMRSAATGLDSSVTGNVATLLRDLGPESSREDIGETANRVLRQMHQVCP